MRPSGWIKIAVGAGALLAVLAVVWATFANDPGSAPDEPGGAAAGEQVDPASDGTGNAGADGSGSEAGSANGSGGGSDASAGGGDGSAGSGDGSDSGGGGDGDDTDPDGPPGPPSMCGAEEFLGPLLEFVARLGDRNLLPPAISMAGTMNDYATAVDFPRGPLAPLGGVLSAPTSIISGFNRAYNPLSDFVREYCPGITGDPHVTTIDGYRYSFQAVGEYQALRSLDGDIDVQVRLVSLGSARTVSGVGGVAIGIDGRALVIESEVTLDGADFPVGEVVATDGGGVIGRTEDGVFVVYSDGYSTVTVTRVGTTTMGLHVALDASRAGRVEGLLGDADGNPGNDLQTPEGPVTDSFESLYGPFRDVWRSTESLFPGPETFDPGHPVDVPRVDAVAAREARIACVGAGVVVGAILEDCILDVGVTGDTEYAAIHFEAQRPRTVVRATSCADDGDPWMVGEGVGRSWSTDPVSFAGLEAWVATVDDQPIRVSAAVPFGSGFVLVDRDFGLRVTGTDGSMRRSIELTPSGAAPVVIGSVVVVPTVDGLAAVDLDSQPCWHLVGHREVVTSLGVQGGVVLAVMTGDEGRLSTLVAIRLADGESLWARPLNPFVSVFGARVPPAAGRGLVFVEGARGQVVALDILTGAEAWVNDPARDDAVSGITFSNDRVLVSRRIGGAVALDAESGESIWSNPLPDGGSTVGLATDGSMAVLVDERRISGVRFSDGATAWSVVRQNPGASGQPVIAGSEVLVPSPTGGLVVLDLASGAEIRRIDAGVSGLPLLAHGFVLLADGVSARAFR